MFGEHPVSGANLRQSAAAVEAERGVVIVFKALQFSSLPRVRSGASFIAQRNAKSPSGAPHESLAARAQLHGFEESVLLASFLKVSFTTVA